MVVAGSQSGQTVELALVVVVVVAGSQSGHTVELALVVVVVVAGSQSGHTVELELVVVVVVEGSHSGQAELVVSRAWRRACLGAYPAAAAPAKPATIVTVFIFVDFRDPPFR